MKLGDLEKAYYALGETEVCTYMNKFSIGVTGWGYMPEFMENALKYPHLREALKMGRQRTVMVIIGNSERDLVYKDRVRRKNSRRNQCDSDWREGG